MPTDPGSGPDSGPGLVTVKGCPLPLGLLYDVPNHMWYEPLPGGLVRLGMTVVAVALANGRIFAFTPKRAGRALEKGRSGATIESSKWVGPARVAFDGVVVAVNDALIDRPSLMVADPYGAGWMMTARPAGDDALAALTPGTAVADAYADWMRANNFPGCGTPAG